MAHAPSPLASREVRESDSSKPSDGDFIAAKGKENALSSEECSPAFRLVNLLSLPRAGKWRGRAFTGMVVRRAALEHPGVEIKRLLDLGAIAPATLNELAAYERTFGETREIVAQRKKQFAELRQSLSKRVRAAQKNSAKVDLLMALIREWSDIESQCRIRWCSEFGVLMGKTQEQIRRHYLDRESDLRTIGGKEDLYRDRMKAIAEPLLIAAAGMSMQIAPLHDFLGSTAHQWNGRNPKEWELLEWLPTLRYKLLHQEAQTKAVWHRATTAALEDWRKVLVAVLVLVITALLGMYLKSRGITLK